jgi:UDP-N-acetyl-D-mannosaminuronic acid dehydrogenase
VILAELARRQERAPDSVAIRTAGPGGWTQRTWAELYEDTLAVAANSRELADRSPVVVIVDNSPASVAAIFGLASAGVDVVLVEESSSFLADPGSAIHDIAQSAVIGPATMAARMPGRCGYRSYEDCRAGSGPRNPARHGVAGSILQLTSGSTGEPKIASQPVRNVLTGGRTYQQVFGLSDRDAIVVPIPMAHSFGLIGGLIAALVSGAPLWTMSRFNVRHVLEALDGGGTVMLGTPLVYRMLAPVLQRGPGSPRPRIALSSGGPIDAELAAQAAAALGAPVRQIYGSTETGLIAYQPASVAEQPWPADSVGVAAPGVRLRVEASDEADAADAGQLYVHTPTLFTGYLGAPSPSRTSDGFYDTGDLARVDSEGRIFLSGRKATFVNVGGRKVNPRRIERIIAGHRGVREVHVFGVTGSSPGEQELHAAVVLSAGTAVSDLAAYCRSRLVAYEVPRHFHSLEQLPRTALGKIDSREVTAITTGGETAVRDEGAELLSASKTAAVTGRVAVVGLGYVGLTLAVSMARAGISVIGVEANPTVRASLRARRTTFFEPGVADLLGKLSPELFEVTDEIPDERLQAAIICVGTAVDPDTKRPQLKDLEAATEHVASHVSDDTLVVVRSTVPVGTSRRLIYARLHERVEAPLLAFCPERTIQGQALAELTSLPQVIGGLDDRSVYRARELFGPVAADQVVVSSLEAAEMIKLVCNAHTDLIYGFGNEVAAMAEVLKIDASEVIAAANLRYPRPDLARPGYVGGSCLTKDPYLLIDAAERAGYHPPMVSAARAVNERVPHAMVDQLLKALAAKGCAPTGAKVFVCGVAYKGRPQTDDVRGSAAVEIVKDLRGLVAVLAGHDFTVTDASIGAIGLTPMTITDGLAAADALVVLQDHPGYRQVIDAERIRASMSQPALVFDVWGELAPELSGVAGIEYRRLGRG